MFRAMEEAALNSWPALHQALYDGWVLRFSEGYTKRANSINPLYTQRLATLPKIAECVALYRARNMPPIFRLTPFAPADLDDLLVARGYRQIDPSLVLRRSLNDDVGSLPVSLEMRDETVDAWMAAFCRLTGSQVDSHRTHREMLERIVPQKLLATLQPAGSDETVACGLAVRDGDHVGIFDLIVDPGQRNRGYGAALMAGLMRWGQEQGARVAYLQVVEDNVIARHLYSEKLGFELAYRYWYRVPTEW